MKFKFATILAGILFAAAPLPTVIAAPDNALNFLQFPRGAEAYSKINAQFESFLRAFSKEKPISKTPSGEVSVVIWRGTNYRPERRQFTIAGVRDALETAGFTVKSIDDQTLRDVNVFEHFSDENLPFRPDTTERVVYFTAQNDTRRQSLVGAWIDSGEALALGLLPVQYVAPPKAVGLPALGTNVHLVKDYNDTMAGLPPQKLPTFPALGRKPGIVRGWVRDFAGRPIAGAQIAVYSSVGGGMRTTHRGRSNAQGLYEVMVPTGIAEIAEGKCKVNYNGRTYELELRAPRGEFTPFNSSQGQVQNLVLQTQGEYGGTIRVLDNIETGVLEITLEPQGRLLDGSVGRTFVYRLSKEGARSETFINGMPLGRYKLTARILDEGDVLPLRASRTFGSDAERTAKSALQVDFEPGYAFSTANTGKSNRYVQYFQVTLEP